MDFVRQVLSSGGFEQKEWRGARVQLALAMLRMEYQDGAGHLGNDGHFHVEQPLPYSIEVAHGLRRV